MKTPTILARAVTVLALTLAVLPAQAAASTAAPTHSAAAASPAVNVRKAHKSAAAPVTPGRDAVAKEQAAAQATEREHKELMAVAYSVMSLLHLCLLLPGFSGRSLRRRDFAFGAQAAA